MLIAQISDLHVMPKGELANGRVDTATMLRDAVAHLNALDPQPAITLITGDLADKGQPAAYANMREILAELNTPFYVIPGNHDKIDAFREAFSDQPYLPPSGDRIHYVVDTWPLRLVAIDSVVPGRTRGALSEERLAWLDETLSLRPEAPTLVLMHHAPFITGLPHFDDVYMDNADGLERVIGRHAQVQRVLCGHVHRSTQIRFGGTMVSSCPSTAHQVALDLRPDGIDSWTLEPPGFQIHRWYGGVLFTHTLNVGKFDGPYPFH